MPIKVCALLLLTACSALTQQANEARSVLRDGYKSRAPDDRREVAVALSLVAIRDPIADLLTDLAKDSDVPVRQAALVTIAELKDRSRVPILKAALEDSVPEVAYTAARSLWSIGDPAGRELLIDIYQEDAKGKSNFVRSGMRNVVRKLKTPRTAFLFAVREGIGFVPVPGLGAGMAAMNQMLFDPDFSARASSLLLICQRKDAACTTALDSAFTDEDWSVRAAAAQIVAGQQDTSRKAKLGSLIHDKSEKVRFRAAAGYLRLGGAGPVRRTGPAVTPPAKKSL